MRVKKRKPKYEAVQWFPACNTEEIQELLSRNSFTSSVVKGSETLPRLEDIIIIAGSGVLGEGEWLVLKSIGDSVTIHIWNHKEFNDRFKV